VTTGRQEKAAYQQVSRCFHKTTCLATCTSYFASFAFPVWDRNASQLIPSWRGRSAAARTTVRVGAMLRATVVGRIIVRRPLSLYSESRSDEAGRGPMISTETTQAGLHSIRRALALIDLFAGSALGRGSYLTPTGDSNLNR
jgi:hypothetical protein